MDALKEFGVQDEGRAEVGELTGNLTSEGLRRR